MTDKSPGQALDEIAGQIAAANRVRLVVEQLKVLADRMERSAKGLAMSSFDDDATAEAMLKVAARGAASSAVAEAAQVLALDAVAKATEFVLGATVQPPASRQGAQTRASSARQAAPVVSVETTPEIDQPTIAAVDKATDAIVADDSFFSEEELRVMGARSGHHFLYGVEIKPKLLQFVRRVLVDARDHVVAGDMTRLDVYERMMGSQTYRRKLFEGAVAEYRSRTGIVAPEPIGDPPPPSSVESNARTEGAPGMDIVRKPSESHRKEAAARDVEIDYLPPPRGAAEQLPLGILPDEAPDFLRDTSAPPPDDRWETPFAGLAYSESEEARVEDASPPAIVNKPSGTSPAPRRRGGFGFSIALNGELDLTGKPAKE